MFRPHKNLVVGVEEKNTGNLTMGAGFSSVDSLVGFAEITQGNFRPVSSADFHRRRPEFPLAGGLGHFSNRIWPPLSSLGSWATSWLWAWILY